MDVGANASCGDGGDAVKSSGGGLMNVSVAVVGTVAREKVVSVRNVTVIIRGGKWEKIGCHAGVWEDGVYGL
ncbi:hypothetical protein Tco_0974766 [Tanacetum coccineum]|uniref:Uncharacterized protein n=1 Tax=Tanacetum coccineum TaxID=301880 RepID=A0ABQ5ECI3_9ASTR